MGSRHFLDFGSLENNEHSKCEWVHEVIWIHGDHVYACMFIFVSVGVHLVEHDMEFFQNFKVHNMLRANKFNANRKYNGICCITAM